MNDTFVWMGDNWFLKAVSLTIKVGFLFPLPVGFLGFSCETVEFHILYNDAIWPFCVMINSYFIFVHKNFWKNNSVLNHVE